MMFILKKGLAATVLPPGIFIVLLLLIGLRLTFSRRWRTGLLTLTMGAVLWGLSVGPVANSLMRGLEADYPIPAEPSGDVIVLLGGGILDRVPDLTGPGAPLPLMMGRVVTAVRLYRRLEIPIIVTGGRVFDDGGLPESTVIKRFLVDLGIPEDRVIEESQARDTVQNARFTEAICQEKGFRQPILLTSAFHLKRAVMAFEAAGMTVSPFPAYFLGEAAVPLKWYHLLPHAGTLYASTSALHEYLGIFYYQMVKI